MEHRVAGLLVLCACNQFFDIPSTRLHDADIDANCALVTPDEDDDCIANADDNCPGIANPFQLDGDQDGVGDECDSRPNVPGERLVAFESFDDVAAAMAAWRDVEAGAQFVFAPGHVLHANENDPFSILQIRSPSPLDVLGVHIGVTVLRTGPASELMHLHLMIDVPDGEAAPSQLCAIDRLVSTGTAAASLLESSRTAGARLYTAEPQAGDRLVIQFVREHDRELRCRIRIGEEDVNLGRLFRYEPTVWTPTGYYAVFARNIALELNWAAVYTY